MKTDVIYQLTGVANGAPLGVIGKGAVDAVAGIYELDLDVPHIPIGWDPVTVIMICCDRMLGFGAKEIAGCLNLQNRCGDNYTILDRSGEGHLQSGRTLFRARATSMGGKIGDKLVNRSQIHEAVFNLLPDEFISRIITPYSALIRQLSDGAVLMTSVFNFETSLETGCFGFTNYPIFSTTLRPFDMESGAVVTVESVAFNTNRRGDGSASIKIRVESSIRDAKI